MRRKDREVSKINELLQIIDECRVCRIGMSDEKGLYIVPMNFGYSFDHGKLELYFHCADEGRKIDALRVNPEVCFEMDCAHALIPGEEACDYGYYFKSVIGNGRAFFIEDMEEKKKALSALMKRQTGMAFAFDDKMAESVTVFKIIADDFTGKDHR